jgi:ubiquitin-conjugating enzyme E2 I
MTAVARLAQERKNWRKDHPPEFVAKPRSKADGSTDLLNWDCVIPGKKGTLWEGCKIKLSFAFSTDYPQKPPIVKTVPVLWHMNVWSSGQICLNLINPPDGKKFADGKDHGAWTAAITIKQVLMAVQELLHDPYPAGARQEVEKLFKTDRKKYDKRLKEEADKYR